LSDAQVGRRVVMAVAGTRPEVGVQARVRSSAASDVYKRQMW